MAEKCYLCGMEENQESSLPPVPSPRLTLRKSAKLRHRSLVEPLFAEGRSLTEYPLRVKWRALGPEGLAGSFRHAVPDRIGPVQMLVTIPKKKRRHAVDRVQMRRRVREAFRLLSPPLRERVAADPALRTLSLAFVYQHNENLPYAEIEKRMAKALAKITRRLWPDDPA